MKTRKLVSLALALCLMVSLLAVSADAATVNTAEKKRWNIMLVVDGSRSLIEGDRTDPSGLRFQALDMLIHQLQSDGNYVGVIVFNANGTDKTDDASMRSGLAVNTDLIELNQSTKQSIIDAYTFDEEDARYGRYYTGTTSYQTDIGTALLVAQEKLGEMNNGQENAIFLFTDGITAVNEAIKDKALENRETAIANIYNSGTKMCGVFLNKDGRSTETEVRDIVAACIGVNPGAYLGELYVEIQDAADLPDAVDAFSTVLGFDVGDDDDGEILYGSFEREFRIPGIGVEEANIRLRSVGGKDLPEDMTVTITRPNGVDLTAAEIASISASGDTFRMYKLVNPESGVWKIKVVLPEGNSVGIRYTPIMSFYIGSQMEVTPDSADLHVNSTVTVSAYLEQGGNKLTDPSCYNEYICHLKMTDVNTGDVVEIKEITPDSSGNYSLTFDLKEYGVFDVQTSFDCGDLSVTSGSQIWNLSNHAPESVGSTYKSFKSGLFQKNEETLNLTEYAYGISDVEDSIQDLTFRIQGGSCEMSDVQISGTKLMLDARTCGNGDIVLEIADTQGATTTLTIMVRTENVTVKIILAIVIAILILVVAVIVIINNLNKYKTEGECAITVWVPRGDTGDGQDICCVGLAPPGSTNSSRKLSLYEMLKRDLDDTYGSNARQACKDCHVKFSDYKDTLDSIEAELRKATASCVVFTDKKSKRKSCNRLEFRYKNIRQTLNNGGSVTITVDGIRVSLAYSSAKIVLDDSGTDGGDDWLADDYSAPMEPAKSNDNWDVPEDPFGSDDFGGSDPFGGQSAAKPKKSKEKKSESSDPWGSSDSDPFSDF